MKGYLKGLIIAGIAYPVLHHIANLTRVVPGIGGELLIFPIILLGVFFLKGAK